MATYRLTINQETFDNVLDDDIEGLISQRKGTNYQTPNIESRNDEMVYLVEEIDYMEVGEVWWISFIIVQNSHVFVNTAHSTDFEPNKKYELSITRTS